jgi:transcriptional regulator NrdR family protein
MAAGIRCPTCNCPRSEVTHVRESSIKWKGTVKTTTRRYRVCAHCGHTWSTVELEAAFIKDLTSESQA